MINIEVNTQLKKRNQNVRHSEILAVCILQQILCCSLALAVFFVDSPLNGGQDSA